MLTMIGIRLKQTSAHGIMTNSLEKLLKQFSRNVIHDIKRRCCHNGFVASDAQNKDHESLSFQDMLTFRRKQALATVLIEFTSKDDVTRATNLCRNFGGVKSFISYTGDYGNEYLLTEFSNENMVKKFLKMCQFKTINDAFPLYSRLLRFEGRKHGKQHPNEDEIIHNDSVTQTEQISRSSCPVSKIIEDVCKTNRLTDLSIRKRFLFCRVIHDAIEGMFPNASVLPFGSSVNSFGSEGSDLDVVLRLYPEKTNTFSELFFQTRVFAGDSRALQQRAISCIYEILRTFLPGVNYVQKILNARVPILKFKHKIFDLDCDISVNNVSAVHMSEILYYYGSLDSRVHPLVFAVKKWAKEANVTYETPGSWITNFSLTLLVIFFLQNRPQTILPPIKRAVLLQGQGAAPVQYIEKLSFWRKMSEKNNESLAALLLEFLIFLSKFPFKNRCVCVLNGKDNPREGNGFPLWIRYPIEEDLNVSKNVSFSELDRLRQLASLSAKHLENYMAKPEKVLAVDFSMLLGISSIKKHHTEKLDISELYSSDVRLSS